ncbi:MAG: hypothetical protein JO100_06065 [Pseudonocardia sp.]|nr:hypothetical protein [Pseudonocardia sp.]
MDLGKILGGSLNMDEVGRAVNFVIANQDDFGRLVEQFKNLPDGAAALLHQLPDLLHTVGTGLAEAGEQAAHAARALIGEDGGGGARSALSGGADIMVSTKEQLGSAAAMLSGVAAQLESIDIPSIAPKFTSIAGMNVISGLDFGSNKLLEGPARSLSEGAATVTGVAGNLDRLSSSLREISDILGSVGQALNGLGDKLASSGNSVTGMLNRPA